MLLNINDLSVSYGEVPVLQGINIQVGQGEIVALLGSNGCGKTTLMKAISGLIPVGSGEILFDGNPIQNLAPHSIVKLGLSQCAEGRFLFPQLSVFKNLRLGAHSRREDANTMKARMETVFSLFPILRDRQKQNAGTLSGGEQQMLSIGRAMMADPRLLILDEPSLGIAPLLVEAIFKMLKEINKKGITLFIVEQNASVALGVAGRGYVMELGKIVREDTSEHLLVDPLIRKAYLGA
jgi:branched-chain amino acid transport system ATP-binding protein